ncbi:MAG: sigma-54 dependent transcriptional regulator [Planctomycetota bacterium]
MTSRCREGEDVDSPHEEVGRLLLVHEAPTIRSRVASAVRHSGFEVIEAGSIPEAIPLARAGTAFAGILLSAPALGLPGLSVAEALRTLRVAAGTDEVIVLFHTTPDIEFSRQTIAGKVAGFVRVDDGRVDEPALRRHMLRASRRSWEQRSRHNAFHQLGPCEDGGFIAGSRVITDLLSKAARAAQISDVPVIIYGESGTGKQLLAETIHRLDAKRCTRRFLAVNCASISGTLADSELFGHAKGAFTGATEDRQGHFRAADGGTLLLDEIGELDPALQPKLLRVLQEGVVLPVGSDEETAVDVRVIAATHRRLPVMVEQGTFRLDLYQRLNVIVLEIPPLRERPEDIPALVEFFLKKYAGYCPTPVRRVDPRVYEAFARRPLTGNVRELENAVRQMLAFKSRGDTLDLSDLQAIGYDSTGPMEDAQTVTNELVEVGRRLLAQGRVSLPVLIEQLERRLLTEALKHSTGTTVDLAKRLGLSRRTFYNKLRKYRL